MKESVLSEAIRFESLVLAFKGSYAQARKHLFSDYDASSYQERVAEGIDNLHCEVIRAPVGDRFPFWYAIGDLSLLDRASAAIVGTRVPSEHGRLQAVKSTREFCSKGYVISSGLAEGVDTLSHETALECGKTIAFLPFSLDGRCYPPSNTALLERIKEQGLVISAFGPWFSSAKWAFLERSRLMAEFTEKSILIEGSEEGGGRKECDWALKYSKTVLVPRWFYKESYTLWSRGFDARVKEEENYYSFKSDDAVQGELF